MAEMSIKEAIQAFMAQSKMRNGLRSVQLEIVWEEIMGKTISKYTEKIHIVGTTLFITTHVGPLKQELHYQRDLIITRVNEALGEALIREVVIQ
jgi:hypothetical protein